MEIELWTSQQTNTAGEHTWQTIKEPDFPQELVETKIRATSVIIGYCSGFLLHGTSTQLDSTHFRYRVVLILHLVPPQCSSL